MTAHDSPPLPPQGLNAPPLRQSARRLGARVREDLQAALESIFHDAARLAASQDAEARAAAEAIEAAAHEIAARLSRFEESALQILAQEASEPAEEEAADVPEPHPPTELTRVLVGELSHLARQADSPLRPSDADVLRPRIRRAARLASLWLTTSVRLGEQPEAAEAPGVTSTHGGRPVTRQQDVAPPHRAPAPPAPQAAAGTGAAAAVVALQDRVERLQRTQQAVQEHAAGRERYWREAVHELRNAAHAFMSWGFVLRRSELKDTPWFAPLVRAAEAVMRRAEEALDPKRFDATSFAILSGRVDLIAAAREALESIRPSADARNISLAAATPAGQSALYALADPDRLQQILHNLLRNAVQATPPSGSICVTVAGDPAHPAIEVEDNGPGVPQDIFDQLPAASRGSAGFGVGLRLSRELAERMGGSLTVAPVEPGTGARFILRLPPAPP